MIKLKSFCSTKATMVVVRETITCMGRLMHTRTGVIILTSSTFNDFSHPGSSQRVITGFIGWLARGNGRVIGNVGPVRKVLPNFLYAWEVVPGKSGFFQHCRN